MDYDPTVRVNDGITFKTPDGGLWGSMIRSVDEHGIYIGTHSFFWRDLYWLVVNHRDGKPVNQEEVARLLALPTSGESMTVRAKDIVAYDLVPPGDMRVRTVRTDPQTGRISMEVGRAWVDANDEIVWEGHGRRAAEPDEEIWITRRNQIPYDPDR